MCENLNFQLMTLTGLLLFGLNQKWCYAKILYPFQTNNTHTSFFNSSV